MHASWKFALVALACALGAPGPAAAQESPTPEDPPAWVTRGLPGPGHAALEPLVGTWQVHKEIYGTLGRDPNAPPLVADDIVSRREWVAGGRYIEDTTEGTLEGMPYWRRGWLGYSSMDERYEWVTIDGVNTTMMIYLGDSGAGPSSSISMSGVFTDQGVVGEDTVGAAVGQRTVISIESDDRHVVELYFTPPGGEEQLADRSLYTRIED